MNALECHDALQDETQSLLLVDVRETDEILEDPFVLSGSSRVLPFPLSILMVLPKEEIFARLEDAARRIGKPLSELRLVTACRSGNRSRLAQETFKRFGIEAENLEGGRNAWGDPL